MSNHLPQWLLLLLHLSIPPVQEANIPPETQWTTCLLVGQHPRQPQKGPQLQTVRDSTLVQGTNIEMLRSIQLGHQSSGETRKEYCKRHSPNFTMEGMHDLSEVFRHMAMTTELLGLAIYKIQEVWKGPDELQQANYTLRSLPKGLKFL